jgi:hypothetical protein
MRYQWFDDTSQLFRYAETQTEGTAQQEAAGVRQKTIFFPWRDNWRDERLLPLTAAEAHIGVAVA